MNSAQRAILSLLLFIGLAYGEEECPILKPANGLDVSEVLGTWYATRGIEHSIQSNSTSPKKTKSCPIIKILSKSEDIIEFQWNSKDKPQKKIELKINKDKPGLLEHANKKGSSKGSFRSLQISTDGQKRNVIAVTMCKSGGRLASVIINREPKFTENEVTSLTNLLGFQGLAVKNLYDRCIKE